MKKLTITLGSMLLLNGCLLEQDLGKNDQKANGTGGSGGSAAAAGSSGAGGSSATGGSGGSAAGGSGGSAAGGSGGSAAGGSGGSAAGGSGGSAAGGSGGSAAGGSGGTGSGGTGSGGTGTGGAGTGGTGGSSPGYDIVAAGLYFSSVKVSGNDVYWTTTGDLSTGNYTYGMLVKRAKSYTWPGSGSPEGTKAGDIQGAGRTVLLDGNAAYVWFSQIIPGWKGGGATKVTFGQDTGKSFLDLVGPGVPAYQPSGDNLIATDATYLYFLCDKYFFDRGICRYPKNPTSGAQFELVVDDPPDTISNIGVSATHVYFTTWNSLERIALGAQPSAQEAVGTLTGSASSMVVAGSDVFVLATDSNGVQLHLTKFAGGAGPGVDLHSEAGYSGSLVVKDGFAYFANTSQKTISKIPTAGGTPSVVVDLSKSKYHPGDFDVDDSHVFVASLADGGQPLADLIHRVPK